MSDLTAQLFTQALGLPVPWEVVSVSFDPERGRIDFEVGFASGSCFVCPECSAVEQPVHDTRRRSWRHLNFFQYETYLHAKVPRVRCGECGKVRQVPVPWARPGSGFTLLFEAMVVTFAQDMPLSRIAEQFHVGDDPLWRVVQHLVDKARAREDHSQVRAVGVDETGARKGHDYITTFCDLDRGKLLYATPGKDQSTVARFAEDLQAHGGQPGQVEVVSMDMSRAFQAGVAKALPAAEITFDPFHVVQLANEALNVVRREEVKHEPDLKGQRWALLKDPAKWTKRQITAMHHLQRTSLKTVRAWRLKESLRGIYRNAVGKEDAARQLDEWCSWARRSRLEPFKKLALTLREHRAGILKHFEGRYSNGLLEGVNSRLQAAKARARGFRRVENFIAMAYLIAGKLSHLPASPFNTTSCGTR